MLLKTLAETSEAVAATRSRLKKVDLLKDCLRQFAPDEVETGVGYLIGALRQASLDGYASESGRPFTADDAFLMWGCEAFLLGKRLDVGRGLRYRAGLAYRLLLVKRRVTRLRRAMTCHLSEATLGPPRAPGTRSPRRPVHPGPS